MWNSINKRLKQLQDGVTGILSQSSSKHKRKVSSNSPYTNALSSVAKYKIATIHSYFDTDSDGYLNYNEMCALERMRRQRISVYQYTHLCHALHCNPYDGVDLRGLQLLYSDRISFLFSYCDVDSDGRLCYSEMCALWRIVHREGTRLKSKRLYMEVCKKLHTDPSIGIGLSSLRKLFQNDSFDLDKDFQSVLMNRRRLYFDNQCTCTKNFASESSSLATCVASSAIIAASTSATCPSVEPMFDGTKWIGNSKISTACNTEDATGRYASNTTEYSSNSHTRGNGIYAIGSSDMTVCAAPSIAIPASTSTTYPAIGPHHYFLSQLGMEMKFCPSCGGNITC